MTGIGLALLSVGFACTAVAASLFPLTVFQLPSKALFLLGFALSLTGLLRGLKRAAAPATIIAVLGLLLVSLAAVLAGLLGHVIDVRRTHPGAIIEVVPNARDCYTAVSFALAAAMCVAFGTGHGTELSTSRFVGRAAAVFAVPALAFGSSLILDRFFMVFD